MDDNSPGEYSQYLDTRDLACLACPRPGSVIPGADHQSTGKEADVKLAIILASHVNTQHAACANGTDDGRRGRFSKCRAEALIHTGCGRSADTRSTAPLSRSQQAGTAVRVSRPARRILACIRDRDV